MTYLMVGTSIVWLAILVYVFRIDRQAKKLEEELEAVQALSKKK